LRPICLTGLGDLRSGVVYSTIADKGAKADFRPFKPGWQGCWHTNRALCIMISKVSMNIVTYRSVRADCVLNGKVVRNTFNATTR
jgi:hypothetical protein